MNTVDQGDTAACSDQSDSGWTVYLQPSSSSQDYSLSPTNSIKTNNNNTRGRPVNKNHRRKKISDDGNNNSSSEEDLSMISDASSGPPHFDHADVQLQNHAGHGYANYDNYRNYEYGTGEINNYNSYKLADLPHLDDTASSPLFFPPQNMNRGAGSVYNVENQQEVSSFMDYSNSPAFSANHFQGRSTNFQAGDDRGFLQSSTFPTGQFQQNQWY